MYMNVYNMYMNQKVRINNQTASDLFIKFGLPHYVNVSQNGNGDLKVSQRSILTVINQKTCHVLCLLKTYIHAII